MNAAQVQHRRIEFRARRELLVVDRQDERRRARLLLRELRQVAVARHAQDFHSFLLDRRASARMPRPDVFSERKSSSMMTMGKRNFMRALLRPLACCAEK